MTDKSMYPSNVKPVFPFIAKPVMSFERVYGLFRESTYFARSGANYGTSFNGVVNSTMSLVSVPMLYLSGMVVFTPNSLSLFSGFPLVIALVFSIYYLWNLGSPALVFEPSRFSLISAVSLSVGSIFALPASGIKSVFSAGMFWKFTNVFLGFAEFAEFHHIGFSLPRFACNYTANRCKFQRFMATIDLLLSMTGDRDVC